jgi:hypothetical protein
MNRIAFPLALLIGSAALAQTAPSTTAYEGDGVATAAFETEGGTAATGDTAAQAALGAPLPGSPLVQPSNAAPERDARGIAVISDPAVVPPGWNGVAATAMGGPELDPATGEAVGADSTYPACTAARTDNCLQTYEKGRG